MTHTSHDIQIGNFYLSFSCRLHQCLTMDAIVSAAFGFQVNSQNNPDDPVLKAAKKAMNQSTSQKILLTFLSTMPFGAKIMEKIPSLWMSNNIPLLNITEEIVRTKRESGGNSSTRKVAICWFYFM